MRRRLPLCAALLGGLLLAGCASDADPEVPASPQSTSESAEQTGSPVPAAGPVASSGATISPKKVKPWCGAVTADQLSALTGYEVAKVVARQEGPNACSTELPGMELQITWGSEPTQKSFATYAAGWDRPPGVFDVTDLELPGGHAAVRATQPVPEAAHAGTVVDGRVIEVVVAEVIPDESTSVDDLGLMAEQLLAVYTD